MKMIISPAKQMKDIDDFYLDTTRPVLLDKSKELVKHLKSLSYDELKEVLNCSDSLAKKAYQNYQTINLDSTGSPAVLSYSGIQYQYMAPHVFLDDEFEYTQNHLRILSGLYGILKPLDTIVQYRLEMQAKCPFSLYDYWSDTLSKEIDDDVILNLASEEYAKCIRKYRKLIDVRFYQNVNGKLKEKGVYAKMARGEMVRFLAETKAKTLEDVKKFDRQNYEFSSEHSTDTLLTFIQKEQ